MVESWIASVRSEVAKVVLGKEAELDLLLVALLSSGHVLLEDVPGVGKTVMARTLARTLDLEFHRIQFTPDLLPSDITGTQVLDLKTYEPEFRQGPLFTQVLLADEINRATPRTQAALLEAMEEQQVSESGISRPLPQPFWVLATQNPIELEGTYPLPEAQLDRFLMRLRLGYPDREAESDMLSRHENRQLLNSVEPVASASDILRARSAAATVVTSDAVREYIVDLARATRNDERVMLGASPRAALALHRAAKASAYLLGRTFVRPDDVQTLMPYIFAHRIILAVQQELRGTSVDDVLADMLQSVPAPREQI